MSSDNEVLKAVKVSANNVARALESDRNLRATVESDSNGSSVLLNDGEELDDCFATLSKGMRQESVASNFKWAFCDSSSGDWWDSKLDGNSPVKDVVSFINDCIVEVERL